MGGRDRVQNFSPACDKQAEAAARRRTRTPTDMASGAADADALASFLLLAKSAKGVAATSLIKQVLEHPSIFVFGELLSMPNIMELAHAGHASSFNLLKIFAYGTWSDYQAAAATLPPLTPAQESKLKKLTVLTHALRTKMLGYATLMRELPLGSVREVEDLLIDCIYSGLLEGRMDQAEQQLEVFSCAGRDLDPSEIPALCATLGAWHADSTALMGSLSAQMTSFKGQQEAARAEQADLDAKVEPAQPSSTAPRAAACRWAPIAGHRAPRPYPTPPVRTLSHALPAPSPSPSLPSSLRSGRGGQGHAEARARGGRGLRQRARCPDRTPRHGRRVRRRPRRQGAQVLEAKGQSVPSLYLPCTFPVPSLYLPCTFPTTRCASPRGQRESFRWAEGASDARPREAGRGAAERGTGGAHSLGAAASDSVACHTPRCAYAVSCA